MTSGPAVRLSRTTEFAPDITVTRDKTPGGGKLTEAPLLAVEVRPRGKSLMDLDSRKAAYQSFGVESYWIIVPDTRWPELTVFELAGNSYEKSAQLTGDKTFRGRRPFAAEVIPAGWSPDQPPRRKMSMSR